MVKMRLQELLDNQADVGKVGDHVSFRPLLLQCGGGELDLQGEAVSM